MMIIIAVQTMSSTWLVRVRMRISLKDEQIVLLLTHRSDDHTLSDDSEAECDEYTSSPQEVMLMTE